MINTAGKLLISAFIVIMIGLALIQVVADDVELVKTSSYTSPNESVTLTVITSDIINETVTLSSVGASTGTLANNWLTVFTGLRNLTSENITSFCNVTLSSGAIECNATGDTTAYADYTYNDYSTGALANDELISFDACRNSTMTDIDIGVWCNVTLTSGAVKVEYDNFTDDLAYIDYVYESDTGYIRGSTSKTLITLVILFFAIGILAVGIGFAWKAFKDSDVM